MKLDNNYSITKDKYNWILNYEGELEVKRVIGLDRECRTRSETYHPSLQATLMHYVDKVISPSKDIKDTLDKLNSLEDRLEVICKGITKKDII